MNIKVVFLMQHIITGGIENCLVQILSQLKKNHPNYEITVISLKPVTETKFLTFFKENKINLIDHDLFNYCVKKRSKNFFKRKLYRILSIFEKYKIRHFLNKYDLVIDYFNGSMWWLVHKIKKPCIAFLHCSINAYLSNKNYLRNMEAYAKIVAISESFYEDLINLHPEKKEKIEFIYNPIDLTKIRNLSKKNHNDNLTEQYFISVARLHTDKDHETLLKAFAKFIKKENTTNVKLYLCGDGPLRKDWEKLSVDLQIQSHVVFLGNVNNPFVYVKNALANILSSFGEGLPTVLIEAQALDVLNVASNVKSGIKEILLNGNAGLLFEPRNSDNLADIMSMIYNKKVNKKKMIKIAKDNLYRFNPEIIDKQINKLFLSVINEYEQKIHRE